MNSNVEITFSRTFKSDHIDSRTFNGTRKQFRNQEHLGIPYQPYLHLDKQLVTAAARLGVGGATGVRGAVAVVDDAIGEIEVDDARLETHGNVGRCRRRDLDSL